MRQVGSPTLAIGHRINPYEHRCEVRILAWLSGAPYGENGRVDAAVREEGYRLVFSNTKIQRLQSR